MYRANTTFDQRLRNDSVKVADRLVDFCSVELADRIPSVRMHTQLASPILGGYDSSR